MSSHFGKAQIDSELVILVLDVGILLKFSCSLNDSNLVTLLNVPFSFPLFSANRAAKLMLPSEISRVEQILHLAEHYWHAVLNPKSVQEAFLDCVHAEQKILCSYISAFPNQVKVCPRVFVVVIELSSNNLVWVRGRMR